MLNSVSTCSCRTVPCESLSLRELAVLPRKKKGVPRQGIRHKESLTRDKSGVARDPVKKGCIVHQQSGEGGGETSGANGQVSGGGHLSDTDLTQSTW